MNKGKLEVNFESLVAIFAMALVIIFICGMLYNISKHF